MSITTMSIIDVIKNHIRESGYGYSSWYVGIARDAKDALFSRHGVREKNDWYIARPAGSSRAARQIETYFVNVLGTAGGPGGGDYSTDMVYAYKMSNHTNP